MLASQEKQGFKTQPWALPARNICCTKLSFPICKMGIITRIWKSGHEMVFEKCLAQERPNTQQVFSTQLPFLLQRAKSRPGLEVTGEATTIGMTEKRLRWEYAGNIRSQIVGPGYGSYSEPPHPHRFFTEALEKL